MSKLKIVADENILLLEAFFASIADIVKVDGRQISAAQVADADALVLRTTAKVNEQLLAGSAVQFVGTCTIGVDHLDTAYMDAQKITWSNAPGCNAEGVVDYAINGINHAWQVHGVDPWASTVGVVGAGNVGGRLIKRLQAAGFKVICSDPPLEAVGDEPDLPYVSLQELIHRANIVCLHTPLIKHSEHATQNLISADIIQQLGPQSVLISAGRGEVVDQSALLKRLQEQADLYVYLDVWRHEPNVDPRIIPHCQIVTPHIAGHSLEGKMRGTEMIYQALCRQFDLPIDKSLASLMPAALVQSIEVDRGADVKGVLNAACSSVYNLNQDDARTRQELALQHGDQVALAFDKLRKSYPVRREFSTLKVVGVRQQESRRLLSGLGFKVV